MSQHILDTVKLHFIVKPVFSKNLHCTAACYTYYSVIVQDFTGCDVLVELLEVLICCTFVDFFIQLKIN